MQQGLSLIHSCRCEVFDIVFAAFILSGGGIWTKLSGQDAFVLAFFRALIPVLFLSILNRIKASGEKFIHAPNRWLILASFLNAVRSLLFFQALILTDISKAVVMLYLWPVFVMVLNIVFKKEKATVVKVLCIVLAFAGIVIIYLENFLTDSLDVHDVYGMTVMMVSSFIYSLTIMIFKDQGQDRNHFEITFYQNLAAVPLFFAGSLVRFIAVPEALEKLSLQGAGFASLNGLLSGVFGFLLYFRGMSRMESSKAGQLANLEVVFTVIAGIILFNEKPGISFLIGAFLIVSAAVGRTFIRK
ncbi:MAG TPA: DMT family transporter [Treponemataceae bacterium]|nr:DMT family transporter [Treponemataceae bacterium]